MCAAKIESEMEVRRERYEKGRTESADRELSDESVEQERRKRVRRVKKGLSMGVLRGLVRCIDW
jgi:hypothetical protein